MTISYFSPSDDVLVRVYEELLRLERENGVETLFAVESGSRSWGFASQNSDYDVRFVYKRPINDYLRLDKSRDTIEWHPEPLYDMVGWDISKYLTLLRKSNPSTLEWLGCPRYFVNYPIRLHSIERLAERCFNPRSLAYHYLGMAKENANEFLRIADGVVRDEPPTTKKYLYVVRALLSARYVCDFGEMPPIDFHTLMGAYENRLYCDGVLGCVDELLDRKRHGLETDVHERISALDEWVIASCCDLAIKANRVVASEPVPWVDVNDLFVGIVGE